MKIKVSAIAVFSILLLIFAAGCSASDQISVTKDSSAVPSEEPTPGTEETVKSGLDKALDSIIIPNMEDIRGNITLCKTVDTGEQSYDVTWNSSDESIICTTALGEDGKISAGAVTRDSRDIRVVLTARIESNGETAEREFALTVKAKPAAIEYGAYLYCYFQDNITGAGQTQQIFFAVSTDGLHWKSLNGDKPVLISILGTKGVRDPFLLRSNEGDKFYILATDLDANGGDWGAYSTNGSRCISIWESDDLVNWSEQRLVDISPKNAECMWAPEACYDEAAGEYIVYWSASTRGGSGKKIYYAGTRDFHTFTQPRIFKDVDRNSEKLKNGSGKIEANLTYIDTTMTVYNNIFYRFTKREIDSTILMEAGSSILGPFTTVRNMVAGEKGVEGPSIFRLIGQEKWILMVDGYAGKGYFPLMADSLEKLETGRFVRLPKTQYRMPAGARHGSFLTITQKEYDAITAKWGY